MKIGVFGGSFNPIHLGHIRLAQTAMAQLGLDKVLVVPASQPPHKKLALGSPAPELRLEMCREALQDRTGMELCDVEMRREGKSYTADTLAQLQAENPLDRLYLIMGMDMFLSLDKWYRPDSICANAAIVVAHREAADEEKKAQIQAMTAKLKKDFNAEVIEIDLDFVEISSTDIRRMLGFGCGKEYLDQRVYDKIIKNGLYTTNINRKGLSNGQLYEDVMSFMAEKRKPHVEGVAQEAVKLAKRWGEDENKAYRAALLHDVTKALKFSEQLILLKNYGIIKNISENGSESVIHAETGAAVARFVYHEESEICSAVRWHTTGKADMSRLEKIIFIADYIEPNRKLDGIDRIRALAYEDLDACMVASLKNNLDYLEKTGKAIHPDTVIAYNYLTGAKAQTIERIDL